MRSCHRLQFASGLSPADLKTSSGYAKNVVMWALQRLFFNALSAFGPQPWVTARKQHNLPRRATGDPDGSAPPLHVQARHATLLAFTFLVFKTGVELGAVMLHPALLHAFVACTVQVCICLVQVYSRCTASVAPFMAHPLQRRVAAVCAGNAVGDGLSWLQGSTQQTCQPLVEVLLGNWLLEYPRPLQAHQVGCPAHSAPACTAQYVQ